MTIADGSQETLLEHREFIAAFESGRLPPEDFDHEAHVRLAWSYLDRYPLLEAASRLTAGLRRFTEVAGVPEKYHETVTLAWLFLINQRREAGRPADWADFRRAHPDLFDPAVPALAVYYRPDTLSSDLARRTFLLPDRDRVAPGDQGISRESA